MFYIGCPMWGYKEWVGPFFPPRTPQSDFLRLYSRRLSTVEGNTTFYATPSAETVEHWRTETPESFRFCFKIPRAISHAARLESKNSDLPAFIGRMRPLQERLGPFFLQLPPSFAPAHIEQLQAFLADWPADLPLAVEVRHPLFYQQPSAAHLNKLLEEHNAARVIMDSRPIRTGPAGEQQILQARERKPDLPVQIAITTNFAFIRYIGHPRMEMNDEFLDNWAKQFAAWLQQGLTLYVFCHCPFEVHSPTICRNLYHRVQKLAGLPPLAWEMPDQPDEVEQGKLF
ncbi:MAG TPA: DUF72 domain-containing protein [Ktedonobacteraceae bacterium]|nr:DUF72 domain-containing protein [Ktedonobacteraceae bacterium]